MSTKNYVVRKVYFHTLPLLISLYVTDIECIITGNRIEELVDRLWDSYSSLYFQLIQSECSEDELEESEQFSIHPYYIVSPHQYHCLTSNIMLEVDFLSKHKDYIFSHMNASRSDNLYMLCQLAEKENNQKSIGWVKKDSHQNQNREFGISMESKCVSVYYKLLEELKLSSDSPNSISESTDKKKSIVLFRDAEKKITCTLYGKVDELNQAQDTVVEIKNRMQTIPGKIWENDLYQVQSYMQLFNKPKAHLAEFSWKTGLNVVECAVWEFRKDDTLWSTLILPCIEQFIQVVNKLIRGSNLTTQKKYMSLGPLKKREFILNFWKKLYSETEENNSPTSFRSILAKTYFEKSDMYHHPEKKYKNIS